MSTIGNAPVDGEGTETGRENLGSKMQEAESDEDEENKQGKEFAASGQGK